MKDIPEETLRNEAREEFDGPGIHDFREKFKGVPEQKDGKYTKRYCNFMSDWSSDQIDHWRSVFFVLMKERELVREKIDRLLTTFEQLKEQERRYDDLSKNLQRAMGIVWYERCRQHDIASLNKEVARAMNARALGLLPRVS